jgi:hypothetical protein
MKSLKAVCLFLLLALMTAPLGAQTTNYESKIRALNQKKEKIKEQEKAALKAEIEGVETRLRKGEITADEAQSAKEEFARKRALNIENRIAIIDNQIALLERNKGEQLDMKRAEPEVAQIRIGWGNQDDEEFEQFFGFSIKNSEWKRQVKYDRRTYSDLVMAFGLNDVIVGGDAGNGSPYEIGSSRFFELGWQWRTRVFENSNWLRFHYGISFQFNGLSPEGNQIFVTNGDQTELIDPGFNVRKAKLRMDNLIVPVSFEVGPSRVREKPDRIRYSIHRQFRLGFGGYAGLNIGTRQKLKYDQNGERIKDKLKRDYNTGDVVYGLHLYAGVGGTLIYTRYELSPFFTNAAVDQNLISLGLRFDL